MLSLETPMRQPFKLPGALLFAFALAGVCHGAVPVLKWSFEEGDEPGVWQGKTGKAEAGPRPPRYPDFQAENRAMAFSGHEGWMVVPDKERGGGANVRFGAGETFAFEAWVKFRSIGKGNIAYLFGKGRSAKHEKLGENNQNYSIRFQGADGGGKLGLLFTSRHPETGKTEWHRWWSKSVVPTSGWHHVALQYTFGRRGSLRAFIDGRPVAGVWDLGGDTDLPPVQDAADLVIGTGYLRAIGSSFQGWVDDLVIYRGAIKPEAIAGRYRYVPPPPPVTRAMLPAGKVLVQVSEKGVAESNAWPEAPQVTESFEAPVFGLFELPHKYVATGVRGERANPSLVRSAALVRLPAGKHRLLLRGRGKARLMVDGKKLLETSQRPGDPAGHGLLSAQDKYLDLGPDFRFAPPGNRDAWATFESKGGEHFVILETLLGGMTGKNKHRPELGETVVAVSLAGSERWSLLSPGDRRVPYTDEGWTVYEAERRQWLARVNAKARAERRAEHAGYWTKRRRAAKAWLADVKPVSVPELPDGFPANNPIDHFIGARIATAAGVAKQGGDSGVDYFKEVRPILEKHCYDCHQGGKAKGGLRIDDLQSMLAGGKSDGPAIVAGKPMESALMHRVTATDEDEIMPPKGELLKPAEIEILKRWIKAGAPWPQFDVANFRPNPLADDLTFLRRSSLDTIGLTPTEAEVKAFLADAPETRRAKAIDRLLDDPRRADHWMGYWLDALAENPNLINPTLNNTGPFRWWLYESLLDNKPADLFVTELIRMEGSERFGGPAGFATASQNDLPMAAKGIIVSSAFLGVEMKCARCHDAPAHVSKQKDLLQLAALLKREPVKLPATSSVPADRLHQGGRKPLIQVSLKPNAVIRPAWPFERFAEETAADQLAENPKNTRDRLAALITAPQNERFAQVMVNRIWQRLMGRGLVPEVSDWEKSGPSHPELLRWLGHRFVESGYDVKTISRLILNSHAYQRATDPALAKTSPLFVSPAPRRLHAEQIVDSVFRATGTPFDLEPVNLDLDSVRAVNIALNLGKPRRSWMLASTSNERDRPSLGLPRITAVTSVLEAFGWRGARQDPVSLRETEPNILQPAIFANGVMGTWLTRLSDRHGMTKLALEEQSVEQLIDRLFLRLLTRKPTAAEKARFTKLLAPGYDTRVIPKLERVSPKPGKREPQRYVTWSNHVDGPANALALKKEQAARRGDPPTHALTADWRLRMGDALWALLNSPEWMYTP